MGGLRLSSLYSLVTEFHTNGIQLPGLAIIMASIYIPILVVCYYRRQPTPIIVLVIIGLFCLAPALLVSVFSLGIILIEFHNFFHVISNLGGVVLCSLSILAMYYYSVMQYFSSKKAKNALSQHLIDE